MEEQQRVDQLFREKTIPEVKNYGMEISRELASVNDRFNEKMSTKYWDILDVTNEVSGLNKLLKGVDQDFRELCYNDNLYQLKKLPDLDSALNNVPRNNVQVHMIEENRVEARADMIVINTTEWTLAIHKFISDISTAGSESAVNNLMENLSTSFNKISCDVERILEIPTFQEVLVAKCNALQDYILKAVSNSEIYLTLLQWIKMDTIFKMERFPWDTDKYSKFEETLYRYVFEEEEDLDDILFGSNNPIVKKFTATESFKNKLVSHMEKSVEEQFTKIKDHIANIDSVSLPGKQDVNSILYPNDLSDKFDVQNIIKTGNLYSMGLDSPTKIALHELVNPLIKQIEKMKVYQCSEEQIQGYIKDLLDILQNMKPEHTSAESSNHYTYTEILNCYNKVNLEHLIESQILAIRQVHNE